MAQMIYRRRAETLRKRIKSDFGDLWPVLEFPVESLLTMAGEIDGMAVDDMGRSTLLREFGLMSRKVLDVMTKQEVEVEDIAGVDGPVPGRWHRPWR